MKTNTAQTTTNNKLSKQIKSMMNFKIKKSKRSLISWSSFLSLLIATQPKIARKFQSGLTPGGLNASTKFDFEAHK